VSARRRTRTRGGPRYEGAGDLIRLAIALQGSSTGLGVAEIAARFRIGRRTAERRLAALADLFPRELEARKLEDGKRWRLRGGAATSLVRVEAAELAALDAASALIERDGLPDQLAALRRLGEKVRALGARGVAGARLDTDVEALLEGQGIAMRPGPRPRIPLDVVAVLREALLACREVSLDYRARIRARETRRVVRPYGFLFGGRHYLVAHDVGARALRMFSLADIRRAELRERWFERPADFDLRAHAARSFGVFQEEPREVVWRFAPGAADAVRDWVFHPTQKVEPAPDGSVVVRFRAGGLWEMAWHLFQWGGDVEVEAPAELRATLVEMLEAALAVHGRSARP